MQLTQDKNKNFEAISETTIETMRSLDKTRLGFKSPETLDTISQITKSVEDSTSDKRHKRRF